MFGYILGLWVILPLVHGHPGIVRVELPLVAWATNYASHGLASPTSSEPQLVQHFLQAGKIIGFVTGLLLQFYFKEPCLVIEDGSISLIIGRLIMFILADSRKFSLH